MLQLASQPPGREVTARKVLGKPPLHCRQLPHDPPCRGEGEARKKQPSSGRGVPKNCLGFPCGKTVLDD